MKYIKTNGIGHPRRGQRNRNRYNHASKNASFSRPNFSSNRFSNQNYRSELEGKDISIFINKAKDTAAVENEIVNKFDDFQIDSKLLANVKHKGYITPTPIQDQA